MTHEEFIAFGTVRHGEDWVLKLALETGYSFGHLSYIAKGKRGITRRMVKQLATLPERVESTS